MANNGISKRGDHKRDRRYPGILGPRPDQKERKQREALERQKEHDSLTTREKLEKCLDRIGRVGGDAVRERTRLEALLSKESAKAPTNQPPPGAAICIGFHSDDPNYPGNEGGKKKLKAKDRRKQEGKR
jgi:hypothetical protein